VPKKVGRDNGVEANLYRPGTKAALLNPMRHVRIVAMNGNSMVLEGKYWVAQRPQSSKSKVDSYQARWIVKHVGAPAVVDAKKLQRRSAARLNSVRASGFDPADDDAPDLPLPE
jgi:hypothetical protein